MRARYDEIRVLGAEVLAVTLSRPAVVAAYRAMNPWPFPVVCDPERAVYRRFGLGRASWLSFLRPRVLCRYVALMVRGWAMRQVQEGEDPLQLGGDFILDEHQRVIFAYPSRASTDRPDVGTLIESLR